MSRPSTSWTKGTALEMRGLPFAGLDVRRGIDDPTGRLLYYDLNALSNFVADPVRMIGFNPYERLAEYLIAEAGQRVEVGTRS